MARLTDLTNSSTRGRKRRHRGNTSSSSSAAEAPPPPPSSRRRRRARAAPNRAQLDDDEVVWNDAAQSSPRCSGSGRGSGGGGAESEGRSAFAQISSSSSSLADVLRTGAADAAARSTRMSPPPTRSAMLGASAPPSLSGSALDPSPRGSGSSGSSGAVVVDTNDLLRGWLAASKKSGSVQAAVKRRSSTSPALRRQRRQRRVQGNAESLGILRAIKANILLRKAAQQAHAQSHSAAHAARRPPVARPEAAAAALASSSASATATVLATAAAARVPRSAVPPPRAAARPAAVASASGAAGAAGGTAAEGPRGGTGARRAAAAAEGEVADGGAAGGDEFASEFGDDFSDLDFDDAAAEALLQATMLAEETARSRLSRVAMAMAPTAALGVVARNAPARQGGEDDAAVGENGQDYFGDDDDDGLDLLDDDALDLVLKLEQEYMRRASQIQLQLGSASGGESASSSGNVCASGSGGEELQSAAAPARAGVSAGASCAPPPRDVEENASTSLSKLVQSSSGNGVESKLVLGRDEAAEAAAPAIAEEVGKAVENAGATKPTAGGDAHEDEYSDMDMGDIDFEELALLDQCEAKHRGATTSGGSGSNSSNSNAGSGSGSRSGPQTQPPLAAAAPPRPAPGPFADVASTAAPVRAPAPAPALAETAAAAVRRANAGGSAAAEEEKKEEDKREDKHEEVDVDEFGDDSFLDALSTALDDAVETRARSGAALASTAALPPVPPSPMLLPPPAYAMRRFRVVSRRVPKKTSAFSSSSSSVGHRDGASVILKLRGGDIVIELYIYGSWDATRVGAGDDIQLVSFAPMLSSASRRRHAARAPPAAAAAARGGSAIDAYRLDDTPGCNVAMIVHPSRLISPSRIAQSFSCLRAAVIAEVGGPDSCMSRPGEGSAAAVMGSMKHELFTTALMRAAEIHSHGGTAAAALSAFRAEWMSAAATKIVAMPKFVNDMLALGSETIDERKAKRELMKAAQGMFTWASRHLAYTTTASSSSSSAPSTTTPVVVETVEGVEDYICAPQWGLKGQLDALVWARTSQTPSEPSTTRVRRDRGAAAAGAAAAAAPVHVPMVMPLELKTGKKGDFAMIKFRAQVILYCAMLVSRFPDNPSVGGGGVLLFIGEEKKRKNQKDAKDAKPSLGFSQEVVAVLPTEVRGVIQARNRLASALVAFEAGIEDDAGAEANGVLMSGIGQSPSFTQRRNAMSQRSAAQASTLFARTLRAPVLPPLLKDPFNCGFCMQRRQCAVLHAAVEGGDARTSGFDNEVKPRAAAAAAADGSPDLTSVALTAPKWEAALGSALTETLLTPSGALDEKSRQWFRRWWTSLHFEEQAAAHKRTKGTPLWARSEALREATENRIGDATLLSCYLAPPPPFTPAVAAAPAVAASDAALVGAEGVPSPAAAVLASQRDSRCVELVAEVAREAARVTEARYRCTFRVVVRGRHGGVSLSEGEFVTISCAPVRAGAARRTTGADDATHFLVGRGVIENIVRIESESETNRTKTKAADLNFDREGKEQGGSEDEAVGAFASIAAAAEGPAAKEGAIEGIIIDLEERSMEEEKEYHVIVSTRAPLRPPTLTRSAPPPPTPRSSSASSVRLSSSTRRLSAAPPTIWSWQLDKNESFGASAVLKENIFRLFTDVENIRLRELVVDLAAPSFDPLESLSAAALAVKKGGEGAEGSAGAQAERDDHNAPPAEVQGDEDLSDEWKRLNSEQQLATKSLMRARDYLLLQGLPGSGKTTTTAFVIRTFLRRGDQPTVLVTAYTHSAVDNVLRKLQEKGVDFIRIGSKHSVHPALHGHLLEQRAAALRVDHSHHSQSQSQSRRSSRSSQHSQSSSASSTRNAGMSVMESIDRVVSSARVVGMTCLAAARTRVTFRRRFDLCVVDEATQVNLPTILGPLRFLREGARCGGKSEGDGGVEGAQRGGVFMLVGDHQQLPPLVQSRTARRAGFDVSLFATLAEAAEDSASASATARVKKKLKTSTEGDEHAVDAAAPPSLLHSRSLALVTLRRQYRMRSDIMLLANSLVYTAARGQEPMICGDSHVANRRFEALSRGLDLPLQKQRALRALKDVEVGDGGGDGEAVGVLYSAELPRWLQQVVSRDAAVLFLNTDAVEFDLARLGGAAGGKKKACFASNAVEANVVRRVVCALLANGASADSIGVISPFRAQNRKIIKQLRKAAAREQAALGGPRGGSDGDDRKVEIVGDAKAEWGGDAAACGAVEVATVDTYQGREKECIILSLVRSDGDTDSPAGVAGAIGDDGSSRRFANGKNEVGLGKLLQDVRRMNVALTRAQSKLVIVGSKRTLLRSGDPFFTGLLRVLQSGGRCAGVSPSPRVTRDWIVELPMNACAALSLFSVAAVADGEGEGQTKKTTKRMKTKKKRQEREGGGGGGGAGRKERAEPRRSPRRFGLATSSSSTSATTSAEGAGAAAGAAVKPHDKRRRKQQGDKRGRSGAAREW